MYFHKVNTIIFNNKYFFIQFFFTQIKMANITCYTRRNGLASIQSRCDTVGCNTHNAWFLLITLNYSSNFSIQRISLITQLTEHFCFSCWEIVEESLFFFLFFVQNAINILRSGKHLQNMLLTVLPR